MQGYFFKLADHIGPELQGGEVYLAGFTAEDSDFVRLNHSAVRQAGSVRQRSLGLDLILGRRHASGQVSLSGDLELDLSRVRALLGSLREQLPHLPEDPHLLYATDVRSTEHHAESRLPAAAEAIDQILDSGAGSDLVGIYASGGIHLGFANSLGQRNWFSSYSFNLDWSLYHRADKAVKSGYAGFVWDGTALRAKMAGAREQLEVLKHEPRTIPPGHYRVYLAPAAVNEILDTTAWGGFGLKDHRTKQTSLLRMVEEGATLHPSVTLTENNKEGVSASFQGSGFLKPDSVTMIERGAFKNCLISPRSAQEYGVPTNGANEFEFPESFDLAAGDIPNDAVLERLGTGVYVNNLWYLNYSDRAACRMTGMTRFATFWVENGKIQAPLNVMRFDESIYRVLGSNLLGLTRERDLLLNAESYGGRSTRSARLPGLLVNDFHFTL